MPKRTISVAEEAKLEGGDCVGVLLKQPALEAKEVCLFFFSSCFVCVRREM